MRGWQMVYSELRPHIKTGDVLCVNLRTFAAPCIRFGQRWAGVRSAQCTHNGVLHWFGDRLFVVEMDGMYNVARPASHYGHLDMRVYRPSDHVAGMAPGTIQTGFWASWLMDVERKYSFVEIGKVALRLMSRGLIRPGDSKAGICSSLAAEYLAMLGYDHKLPEVASPGEIEDYCRVHLDHVLPAPP